MINEAETMKNKEIARKFYELIAAKKYDEAAKLCSDDFVYYPQVSTRLEGVDKFIKLESENMDPAGDFKMETKFIIAENDRVAVYLTFEGDLIGCDPVEDLVANIEKRFRPLSDHPELMIGEVPPLCTAYIHPKEQILLIALPGHLNITLLTPKKIAPNVLEEIEHSTGLEFFPAYP